MFSVEVDFAPAYELALSLEALVARKFHRLLDLGADWPVKTRRRLSPELREALRGEAGDRHALPLDLLVRYCPGERSAARFIDWVRDLSAGDIYELVAQYMPDGHSLPRDLAETRDRWARILELWNEEYFSKIDPAILKRLYASAEHWAAKAEAAGTDPQALVEAASGGVVLEPEDDLGTVLLVPQYHTSPVNTYTPYRGLLVNCFPVEAPPPAPGYPKPASVRLVRALADTQRLRTLRYLGEAPRSFTDVVRFLGQPKSTVHYHMVTLRAAGLVRVHTPMRTRSRPAAGQVSPGGERYSLRAGALAEGLTNLSCYLLQKENERDE